MDGEAEGLPTGMRLFNQGLYWEAHEAWESCWMPDRHGRDAAFYKGLIQVAAGSLHYRRHNRKGALMKWGSGADLLRPYLPSHLGIDLAPLVASVDSLRRRLEQSASEWPDLELPQIQRA